MASHDSPVPAKRGSSIRLLILLAILAVVGLAAGWDYMVARAGYERTVAATEQFFPAEEEGTKQVATTEIVKFYTPEEVHAGLKLEPTDATTHGQYLIERYSWRRGIPWKTYDLWLVYSGSEEKTLFDRTTVQEEADRYLATSVAPVRMGDGPPETAVPVGGLSGETPTPEEPPVGDGEIGSDPPESESPTTESDDAPLSDDAPKETPSSETPSTDPAPAEEETPAADAPAESDAPENS